MMLTLLSQNIFKYTNLLMVGLVFSQAPIFAQNSTATTTTNTSQTDNNIQVDDKVTSGEKKHYEAVAEHSDQYAPAQAEAVNKVPGVEVSPEDLKEKPKKGMSLNPIAWLFKPVTQLQEQSVRLEQQIMKLTGPIAALQPGMLGLEKKMSGVQDEMSNMQGQLSTMQKEITAMHTELGQIKKPIMELKEPIVSLKEPIDRIEKPITGVDKDLTEVKVLLGLILTAIFITAAVIAIGTPAAAILVWRNRSKFLPPPTARQAMEEHSIAQAAKTADGHLRR